MRFKAYIRGMKQRVDSLEVFTDDAGLKTPKTTRWSILSDLKTDICSLKHLKI